MHLNHANSLHGFSKLQASDKTQDLTVTVELSHSYAWELNQTARSPFWLSYSMRIVQGPQPWRKVTQAGSHPRCIHNTFLEQKDYVT